MNSEYASDYDDESEAEDGSESEEREKKRQKRYVHSLLVLILLLNRNDNELTSSLQALLQNRCKQLQRVCTHLIFFLPSNFQEESRIGGQAEGLALVFNACPQLAAARNVASWKELWSSLIPREVRDCLSDDCFSLAAQEIQKYAVFCSLRFYVWN